MISHCKFRRSTFSSHVLTTFIIQYIYIKSGSTNDLCNDSKWTRYNRADMIMKTRKILWNILFSNWKSDLKISLVLSYSFLDLQCRKMFLVKLWQPWMFLNVSATSALVSHKLASYKKECSFFHINAYLNLQIPT